MKAEIRIATERRLRGWSQSELGRRSRVNQTTISAIENGWLKAYPSQLQKLARALGWPLSEASALLEHQEPTRSGLQAPGNPASGEANPK